ncbi:hypothetical protein CY34DRAFT_805854 [Suillus luteus UH-Slu-Lm8-n1]|uniref:Uncharacterized protein n=1 Tax=Suillus luteus UH-Slu-Lm8-n1 TaxID=930992 RepID=A0A0C9ZUT7_9AGAM|nr:hypothetical protein CY34DRAFT_805854 [Suillus luteus UH-Slu-Lm8-n1]
MNQQLIGCLPLLHVPRFRLINQSRRKVHHGATCCMWSINVTQVPLFYNSSDQAVFAALRWCGLVVALTP